MTSTTITLGDFLHNYPEIIVDAKISSAKGFNHHHQPKVSYDDGCNPSFSYRHSNNINNNRTTSDHHQYNNNNYYDHQECRTTRSINLTRIIPFSEESCSNEEFQSSSAPLSSDQLTYLSSESNANCSIIPEENCLDDYRAVESPNSTNSQSSLNSSYYSSFRTTNTCLSTVSSVLSLEDLVTMPVKNISNKSNNSIEDLSIQSYSEEEDWMYLLFQDGLRMIDSESREWIFEHVDFDCQLATSYSNTSRSKKSTSTNLERTNVSMTLKNLKNYIDWKECKHASHIEKYSKFAKSAGGIHYYKPSQSIIKKSKLSKSLMSIVSSENFGMATMLVCPPLILAHWYAVYQKESIELNSAQYFESEWVFNNREQCLETIAVLNCYPKSIQKHMERYSQDELDAVFPKKIVSKRISYDFIRKHGFNIEKVESNTGSSTPTFSLKCGSEILIEFISSMQFCTNLIKLFTFMPVSFISRTMALSVDILCEQLRRVNEETAHEEILETSQDGEAILYHPKLIYSS